MKKLCISVFLGISVVLSSPVYSQVTSKPIRFSSGTGFFVSRQGQLITNAHVVSSCADKDRIFFKSNNSHIPREARLMAIDNQKDLALLSTGYRPERIATLRWMHTQIKAQEKVLLFGYPEAKSIRSPYVVKTAMIKALQGPFGENSWLQFTDSARQGNSGGPLLDFAGNVVGVVTAKSKVVRMNNLSARQELIDESDIAVTAAELKRFLDKHRIHYQQQDSLLTLSERRIEQMAASYVVHIFCSTEETVDIRF